MWYLRKTDPLSSILGNKHVSFVGGGGKTSFAEALAARAFQQGRSVAITTTTKIWARPPFATLDHGTWQGHGDDRFLRVGKTEEKGKLTGLFPEEVEAIGNDFDLVLNEADGAKGMPLKYPASFEPVIPPCTELIVIVAGLDSLSRPIADVVFRSDLLAEKRGVPKEGRVTIPFFLSLFETDALLKGVDPDKCLVVLNKYDACLERARVLELARLVSERLEGAPVIVASTKMAIFYRIERA